MEGKTATMIETAAMTRPFSVRAIPLLALVVLVACAPRATRSPDPPPTGPFRTATGAPTHPRCVKPERQGPAGAMPRCVVSVGRGTTAMTASPDGRVALVAFLDVDPTAWALPAVAFAHHFAAVPPEPGEEAHGEREGPQALAVGPDSRTALFAVEDRLIRYDLASGALLGEIPGPPGQGMVEQVAWSHDGTRLLAASAGDGRARLLDAANGRVLRTIPLAGRVVELAFAPDDRFAVVGTEIGTIAIVDLGAPAAEPRVLTPSTQEITGLAFLGRDLLVAARDGTLALVDLDAARLTKQATTGAPITRFAFDPRTGLVAVADDLHVIRVYDTPALGRRAEHAWHQASITALAWGLGPTLLAADNDGELAAWDVQ
jgi:WD40 repeat protein